MRKYLIEKKFIEKIFGWRSSKMDVAFLSHGTLKSVVSQEWINESTCFFACWHKFRKAKCSFLTFLLGMAQNGRGLLSHWTLKSAVSWINESTFFFYFFGGHGTKWAWLVRSWDSAVPQKWIAESSWIFACW